MNHLVPCPECSRHVRVSEQECPFCALPLDLAGTPEPQLPRTRLGRAATFAFGATLVSATALAGCSSDSGDDSSAGGTSSTAGTSSGTGGSSGSSGATGVSGSTSIAGTTSSLGGSGSAMPVYGAPAAGAFGLGGAENGTAGTGNGTGGGPVPVYGAAP